MLAITAFALTITGIIGLRLAWQAGRDKRPDRQRLLRLLAWTLLVVSLWPWIVVGGTDRGPALAALIAMITGMIVIIDAGLTRVQRQPRRERRPTRVAPTSANNWQQRLGVFFLAGPLAGAASLLAGLALWLGLERIGVSPANVLASSMLFIPLCWAVLATLSTLSISLRTRSVCVLGVTAASLLLALSLGA